MAGNEDSYVPKSPDFSSFFAQPSQPPFPPIENNRTQQPPHHPHQPPPGGYQIPRSPAAHTHAPSPAQAPQLDQHPPQFQPHSAPTFSTAAQTQPGISPYNNGPSHPGGTPHPHQQPHQQPPYQYQPPRSGLQPPHQPPQQYPPHSAYPGPHQPGHHQPSFPQGYPNQTSHPYQPNSHPYSISPGGAYNSPTSPQQPIKSEEMAPRRGTQQAPQAPPIEPSPVKTKFPTARIKRIMQADEEVGKVAQQTPIAVGKALELFMISMVSKSADLAKEKGQKRVTAQMLKQVAETDEQFDFLNEIVSKVEATEEKTKNSRIKAETDSDEEAPEPKRRSRGGRRKKAA
ncbi:hypothetical protein VUR80DRAFT_2394 [Thermomyces stellatus]